MKRKESIQNLLKSVQKLTRITVIQIINNKIAQKFQLKLIRSRCLYKITDEIKLIIVIDCRNIVAWL
jgi:hypothetical protein